MVEIGSARYWTAVHCLIGKRYIFTIASRAARSTTFTTGKNKARLFDAYIAIKSMSNVDQNVEITEPLASSQDTVVSTTDSSLKSSQTTSSKTVAAATGTLKRQRTLMEMVSSPSVSKKPRLDGKSISTITDGKSNQNQNTKIVASGVQPLNSIPFSLSTFQESLSEEVRPLLQLECETMGKSW